MKYSFFLLTALVTTLSHAQTKFPMGDGLDKWGLPIKFPDSELDLRLGARFQSLATVATNEDANGDSTTKQDFFARRVRFQFQAKLPNNILYYMDVRNDNANKNDSGEQKFNIGDAYAQIPLVEGSETAHALRLYRAKVDVSRTETVSSSEILFVNRPFIADEAAQFVNHNRRATNVQLVGVLDKKLSYQIVMGDGVYGDEFNDAQGNGGVDIERQNFMMGGKLRFHPFEGWADIKPTETYFGEGKVFSIGAGFFNTSNIFVEAANDNETISRNLTNFEATAGYQGWFFTGEYFIFDGVTENNEATNLNVGKSEGYYIQGEKVLPNFHFLAPFARYERWDRFLSGDDYLTVDKLYGINWYLNGNRFKMSFAYEHTDNGEATGLPEESEAYHIATAWHF